MPLSAGREQSLTPWPDEVSVTGDWGHVVTNRTGSLLVTLLRWSSPPPVLQTSSHTLLPLPPSACLFWPNLLNDKHLQTQADSASLRPGRVVVMRVPDLDMSLLQNIHSGSPVDRSYEALPHKKREALPWQCDGDGISKLPNKCLLCSPLKCL